jgi:rhodanese-related sulfurtransferase
MKVFFLCLSTVAAIAVQSAFAVGAENTKDSLEKVKKNVAEEKAVLVEQLEKILPEDRILYTFCVVGKRAVSAATILEKVGYEVRALKPGYKELVRAGFKQAEKKE